MIARAWNVWGSPPLNEDIQKTLALLTLHLISPILGYVGDPSKKQDIFSFRYYLFFRKRHGSSILKTRISYIHGYWDVIGSLKNGSVVMEKEIREKVYSHTTYGQRDDGQPAIDKKYIKI